MTIFLLCLMVLQTSTMDTEIASVNFVKDGMSKTIFFNLQELPNGSAEY